MTDIVVDEVVSEGNVAGSLRQRLQEARVPTHRAQDDVPPMAAPLMGRGEGLVQAMAAGTNVEFSAKRRRAPIAPSTRWQRMA